MNEPIYERKVSPSSDRLQDADARSVSDAILRRTLIICWGGAGRQIGVHLKGRLIQTYGPDAWKDRVLIRAFDTDLAPYAVNTEGTMVALEPGVEWFGLDRVDVRGIRANLHKHPSLEARLASILARLSTIVLIKGAKQIRPLGLLAFLWYWAKIEDEIESALRTLADRETANTTDTGLTILHLTGLGGGTGSGQFLDGAYLTRHLLQSLGSLGTFSRLIGIGVLPEAFEDLEDQQKAFIKPNTTASLIELNHAQLYGDFEATYSNGRSIKVHGALFDRFFVLDGVDDAGQVWPNRESLFDMAARSIVLLIGSTLGQAHDAAADNVDAILSNSTPDNHGTFLESFGTAELVWPARDVAKGCAAKVASETARVQIGAVDPEKKPDLLFGKLLDLDRTSAMLVLDDQGRRLDPTIAIPGYLKQASAKSIPAQAIGYLADFWRVRLQGDLAAQIAANRAKRYSQIESDLFGAVLSLASQAGLLQAKEELRTLKETIDIELESRAKLLVEKERLFEQLKARQTQSESVLRSAAEGLSWGRKGRTEDALGQLFKLANQAAQAYLQYLVEEAITSLLSDVGRYATQLSTKATSACERLSLAADDLSREADDVLLTSATHRIGHFSLAEKNYVTDLAARFTPDPHLILKRALENESNGGLYWADMSAFEVCDQLRAICRSYFEPLAAMTIEEVMRDQSNLVSPQARLRDLIKNARAAWNLDLTRLQDGGNAMARSVIVGVSDATNSIYAGLGHQLVSTGDSERLVVLIVASGAPMSAIQQWLAYEESYQSARAVRPLHVMPAFLRDANEARLAFALGESLHLIKRRGSHYYYHPEDKLAHPINLGQGLANAVQSVIARDDLVDEIHQRVNQAQSHFGIQSLVKVLKSYINQPIPEGSANESLVRSLRQLVRQYVDDLEFTSAFDWDKQEITPIKIEEAT